MGEALNDDRMIPAYRAENNLIAEHIRLLLIANDIRAVVFQNDALALGSAIAEVLVISADHARTTRLLNDANTPSSADEWICPFCSESVPGNFDLCWNCGVMNFTSIRNNDVRDATVIRHHSEQPVRQSLLT